MEWTAASSTYIQPIEDLVTLALWRFLEYLKILEDLRINFNLIVETNTVLPEEIEDDLVWRLECDVLKFEGATANSVSFVVALFVSSTECELID